jgi:GT2 family glycosyltransferase
MNYFTIVIPTLNRADLLQESYEDLKEKMLPSESCKGLIVIDNGDQDLEFLKGDTKVNVIKPGKNLGVAASWNLGIKNAFLFHSSDFCLVLNDDVVFGKTAEEVTGIAEKYRYEKTIITSHFHLAAFIIYPFTFGEVGEFDEGFYPAYCEDKDYEYRLKLAQRPMIRTHNMKIEKQRNSMTIKKDPQIIKNLQAPREYYKKKWGGRVGEEKYTRPWKE